MPICYRGCVKLYCPSAIGRGGVHNALLVVGGVPCPSASGLGVCKAMMGRDVIS